MKKRRLIPIALGLIAAIVLTVFIWPGEREPEYQGKKLSEWLHGPLTTPDPEFGFPNEQEQDAIRHIGTNAIPCLLRWICYKPSRLRGKVDAAGARLPWGLANTRFVSWLLKNQGHSRAKAASAGFIILGPQAGPAVPELARLGAAEGSPPGEGALQALASIGQQGFPTLLSAIGDIRHPHRQFAMELLYGMKHDGVDISPAVPVLVNCLLEKDPLIASWAARTLGDLSLMAEISVPALGRSLRDSRLLVRYLSAISLRKFYAQARPIVPELLVCLNDAEVEMRIAATNALQRIAPEVLPRGVQEWQPLPDGGAYELIPLWLQDLNDPHRVIREEATNQLSRVPTNFFPKAGP